MALVFLTVYCKILPFEAFSQHARKHAYVKRSMKRLIFSVLANMQLLKAFLRAFSHKSGSKAPSFSRFFCVLFYVFIRFVGVRRLVQVCVALIGRLLVFSRVRCGFVCIVLGVACVLSFLFQILTVFFHPSFHRQGRWLAEAQMGILGLSVLLVACRFWS
jgi:hypothetical protein